ncbi:hypothetical protein LCGC14_0337950 [marine sediment metagenome]|uniref:Uncharacterized protein n=1 Tax=marine sediment metagenome TaxID=412755 RepID=A0A0F9W1P0_9ZZZZ
MPTTQTPILFDMGKALLPGPGVSKEILLSNFLPTLRGTKRKRGAQIRFGSAISGTPTVTGVFDFHRSDGRQFVIITAEDKIFSSAEASSDRDDISKSGLSWAADSLTSFAVLDDKVVMCNRAGDAPQFTDGGGLTQDVTGMGNHKYVVSHKGRLFAAGKDGASIDYSGVNDILDWSNNGGTITNIIKDHGKITGLSMSHFNLIYVFYAGGRGQSAAIYRLNTPAIGTPSDWTLEPVVRGITTLSHQSIVPVGNDIGFVSNKPSFHLISTVEKFGDLEATEHSLAIEDSWKSGLNTGKGRLENIVGIYYGEENLVCFGVTASGSSTNDLIYSMSTAIQDENGNFEWQEWKGLAPISMATINLNGRERLITGDTAGFVNLQDDSTFSDNGSAAITGTINLGSVAFINPVMRKGHKRLKYAYINNKISDTATLTYRVSDKNNLGPINTATMNVNGQGFVMGTNLIGDNIGEDRILSDEVEIFDSGERMELSVAHSTNETGLEIMWLSPMVTEESH